MEELIALYLFQNKTCPLPGVGTLSVTEQTASFEMVEKQVLPPLPVISFSPAERSPEDFLQFISRQANIPVQESTKRLEAYCEGLRTLDAYAEEKIPGTGKFYINEEGSLVFRQEELPGYLLPPVAAERIIHPESTHAILVGDKESNSALMTEFYSEAEPAKKSRWWIWALLLSLLAIAVIVIYFNDGGNGTFGNATKVPAQTAAPTYKQPN
jgi:hypothetical protein